VRETLEQANQELKAALDREQLRARTDDLTGLHNRRGFFMFAEAELRRLRERGTSAVLVFADLDGLKAINDRHGHAAGDTALRAVARGMREVVGAQGLTARWSGDEFVALIPDVATPELPAECDAAPDAAAAEAFDQRLVAALARHVPSQTPYRVSASVGARRLGPDASETLAAALAAADAGLYRRRERMRTPSSN
jgi:diguanylate cyclase (GGDEF)-like protein